MLRHSPQHPASAYRRCIQAARESILPLQGPRAWQPHPASLNISTGPVCAAAALAAAAAAARPRPAAARPVVPWLQEEEGEEGGAGRRKRHKGGAAAGIRPVEVDMPGCSINPDHEYHQVGSGEVVRIYVLTTVLPGWVPYPWAKYCTPGLSTALPAQSLGKAGGRRLGGGGVGVEIGRGGAKAARRPWADFAFTTS